MSAEDKTVSPPKIGRRPRRRAGFSFTEILFAVMILGIGFIMVAAMFPVAIQQTQESLDETTAADMAKEAGNILARIGNDASTTPGNTATGTFPDTQGMVICPSAGSKVSPTLTAGPTGTSATTVPPFWNLIAGNLISGQDSRYAWVPFYRRGNSTGAVSQYSNFAQVIIIPVLDRNTGSFAGFNANGSANAYDLIGAAPPGSVVGTAPYANLQGRMVSAWFYLGAGSTPDIVTIGADTVPGGANLNLAASPPTSPGPAQNCAAPGAYLIVADDAALKNSGSSLPSCNGYIYQLGVIANKGGLGSTTYYLAPGNDMKNARYQPLSAKGAATASGNPPNCVLNPTPPAIAVRCYLIGRGFNNPTLLSTSTVDAIPPFTPSGPAMDITAFSTFFRVQ